MYDVLELPKGEENSKRSYSFLFKRVLILKNVVKYERIELQNLYHTKF